MHHAVLALIAAGMLLAPAAGVAQTITCEPASSPLLEVIDSTSGGYELPPSQTWRALVLCKDGRLVTWSTSFGPSVTGSPPPFPFHAFAEVGRATPDSLATLQQAMVAARIGLLSDCGALITSSSFTTLKVTWHGRGQRTHTFDIGDLLTSPDCSDSAFQLFEAILTLQFAPGSSTLELQ